MGDLSQGDVFFLLVPGFGISRGRDPAEVGCPRIVHSSPCLSVIDFYGDSSCGNPSPTNVSGGMGACDTQHVGNRRVCCRVCRGPDVFDAGTVIEIQTV